MLIYQGKCSRVLDADSNLCYGEGGAGTWSDGKLTTRIGRNSGQVRRVLQELVRFGAPSEILVLGKPPLLCVRPRTYRIRLKRRIGTSQLPTD